MRLSYSRMVLALAYAAASYLVLFYLLPRLLSGLGSAYPLPSTSLFAAAGIVVLEAVSALFSTTRFRGAFMVALGLLAYFFVSSAFGAGLIRVEGAGYSVGVNIAYIVLFAKLLAIVEAARGVVALLADNL